MSDEPKFEVPRQEIPRELHEKPELGAPPVPPPQLTKEEILAKMGAEFKATEAEPFTLQITPFHAFQMVGCLQLAWRDPRLGQKQKEMLQYFGKLLTAGFVESCPQAARGAELGWHINVDMPINPCPHCIREKQTKGLVTCKYHRSDVQGSRIIRPGG